jgi:CHAT domain-containing protein
MNLGGAYIRKNDCYLAMPHYERALALARAAGFSATTAEILGNLANCERGEGRISRSVDMMNESVALLESTGLRSGKLGGIVHRLLDQARDGNFAAAEAALIRAREVAVKDDVESMYLVKYASGMVRAKQQRFAEALAEWEGLDHVFAEKPNRMRAVAFRRVGRHADAERELRKLIDLIETMRPKVSTDYRQLLAYNDRDTLVYYDLVDLLVECGRHAEALDVYERHRASVLRDLLAGGGVDGMVTLTAAERARIAELEQTIGDLSRALAAGAANRTSAERRLAAARLELAKVTAEAYADDPDARWPAQPPPPPVHTLSIAPGAVFVAFCVLPEQTIAFTVSRDEDGNAAVAARVIPIRRDALRERVAAFTRQVEQRDFAIGRAAEELYALLLRGAGLESLEGVQRLSIVADDALWQLPFHALKPAPRSYLLEHVTVSYAPSIGSIEPLASGDRARVVALGDPAVPNAALEAQRLRQFYGAGRTRVAVHDEATEAVVKQAAGYDVLHIAAHAVVDKSQPLYSALLLSAAGGGDDGYLEAREIASLDLRDRLVVLAACETARGRTMAAEGVVGLPWAVLAAGARATVLSLWRTDSASTADTMIEFHRHHARGAAPDEALRQAQLAMLQQPRYRHPLYWAPFVVVKGGR